MNDLSSPQPTLQTSRSDDRTGREWFLVGVVVMMVIAANIPADILTQLRIERDVVIGSLGLLVFLALFLYLQVFFFLLYASLIVGANLPDHIADALGISQGPMLIALVVMVTGALINSLGMYMPTGTGVRRKGNPAALESLIKTIERQRLTGVQAILEIQFDLNQAGRSGFTPLMVAARHGHVPIISALLYAGADRSIAGPEGTAAQIAAKAGFPVVADLLQPPSRRVSAELDTGKD